MTNEEMKKVASHYGELVECEHLDFFGIKWKKEKLKIDVDFMNLCRSDKIRNISYKDNDGYLTIRIKNCFNCPSCRVKTISEGEDEYEVKCELSDELLTTTKLKNFFLTIPNNCPLL